MYSIKNESNTNLFDTNKTHIMENSSTRNQGIILFKQSDFQNIYKQSGPNAKLNEFQVHFWSLNFRLIFADKSLIDIAIPTVYFNYKQTVSSAHIAFDMLDVNATSKVAYKLHTFYENAILYSGFLSNLKIYLATAFDDANVTIEITSNDLNSLHRHPGSSTYQTFSGTDLCKDPDNHGIVYALESGNNKANYAGIMAIDNKINNLAHMEYRLVNGKVYEDLTYEQNRCSALVLDDITKVSQAELFLNVPVKKYYEVNTSGYINESFKEMLKNSYETFIAPLLTNSTRLVLENNILVRESYTSEYLETYKNDLIFSKKSKNKKNKALFKKYTQDILNISNMSINELLEFVENLESLNYGITKKNVLTNRYNSYTKDELIDCIIEYYDKLSMRYLDTIDDIDRDISYL